jgi:hypothetical protein
MVSKCVLSGQIWGQGIARHSDNDVDILERDAVDAIDAVLADSPTDKFQFGDKPCGFDSCLFVALSGNVEIDVQSPLKKCTIEKQAIRKYVKLVNSLHWSNSS